MTRMLRQQGWRVVGMVRSPQPGDLAIAFQLGCEVAAADLSGARGMVHCAYDSSPLAWERTHLVNVQGTEKLLQAAREAEIRHVVYISSISAFEGCRSLYGKAKLETERIAFGGGAVVLRPGLIYGRRPAGMFGRLVAQVETARVLPLMGGGPQIQYLVHDEDLCRLICACVAGSIPPVGRPITIAHEQPWPFRQLLEAIACARGKSLRFIPVPWRLAWALMKLAEMARLNTGFRSDSLLSLMYQNPHPSFELQRSLGIACRPFQLDAL